MVKPLIHLILLFSATGCVSPSTAEPGSKLFISCKDSPQKLETRSRELQAIARADQSDRNGFTNKTLAEIQEMARRDVRRRKRVGEIFGEGCFSKAEDFAAAALVYQHGDVPEHHLQAFMWAKRAVELGDDSNRRMMALAIDRYLVKVGHKQLFGTQASKPIAPSKPCWCLEPIEPSFPDHMRSEISGKSLGEVFEWLKHLNKGSNCPEIECSKDLKPSPEGTVPGFW